MDARQGAVAERMLEQWTLIRADLVQLYAPLCDAERQSQRAARVIFVMGPRDMALGAGFVDRNGPAVGRL
jgi:hypothetical protein